MLARPAALRAAAGADSSSGRSSGAAPVVRVAQHLPARDILRHRVVRALPSLRHRPIHTRLMQADSLADVDALAVGQRAQDDHLLEWVACELQALHSKKRPCKSAGPLLDFVPGRGNGSHRAVAGHRQRLAGAHRVKILVTHLSLEVCPRWSVPTILSRVFTSNACDTHVSSTSDHPRPERMALVTRRALPAVAAKTTVARQRQSRSRRAGAKVGGRWRRQRGWRPLIAARRRALVAERERALVVGRGLALVVELGHALVVGRGRGAGRNPAVAALLLPARIGKAPALVVPKPRPASAAARARRLVPLRAGGVAASKVVDVAAAVVAVMIPMRRAKSATISIRRRGLRPARRRGRRPEARAGPVAGAAGRAARRPRPPFS